MNDIADGNNFNVTGLPGAKQNNAEPHKLLALLCKFLETAERMIDAAVRRSKTGARHIFHVGGVQRCKQSENKTMQSGIKMGRHCHIVAGTHESAR
eukprot:2511932-Pyramimonas_sp.AAC.1